VGILEAGIGDEGKDRMDVRSRDVGAAILDGGRRYATAILCCFEEWWWMARALASRGESAREARRLDGHVSALT
jgi:hypothetical protein